MDSREGEERENGGEERENFRENTIEAVKMGWRSFRREEQKKMEVLRKL